MKLITAPLRDGSCFVEADPLLPLARRASAEAVGAFLLTFTVIASALTASSGATGLITRALSVGPTLTALILLFGPVSGGHYNPLITTAQWLRRSRSDACLLAYVAAQLAGGLLAARLAVLAFGGRLVLTPPPPAWPALLGAELFASTGLMLIVLGAVRMRPAGVGPFAAGAFVAMTITALSAGAAANPTITLAALAAGLAASPAVALAHLAAEAAGLALALLADALIVPRKDPHHGR